MNHPAWAHQVEGLKMISSEPAVMLAWEMGTGKSRVIVDAVRHMKLRCTLIACPKSVVSVWPAEFRKHGIDGDSSVIPPLVRVVEPK